MFLYVCDRKKYNFLQDPISDGEQKIKRDYEELYEEMQAGFRNLLDWVRVYLWLRSINKF